MISKDEITRIAAQWGLGDQILEKDYALGWLLWGIAKTPALSETWILKGGSCIKKCYVDTHRYSQDLDFTILPGGLWKPEQLHPIFDQLLELVSAASGINFKVQPPLFKSRPHGGSTEGRVYFIGPRGDNSAPTAIKLDITFAEDLVRPPVLRSISHAYSDLLPDNVKIYCYSLEELFAEKVRAIGERQRPSDVYDVIYLFRRSDLNAEPELISKVLEAKCIIKGISIPEYATVSTDEARLEVQNRWQSMLGRGMEIIPDFDDYWQELEQFFAWLKGEEYITELVSIGTDDAWVAPSIEWQRGQSEWLEPIRYAAVNRLQINLGYQNKSRLVEPYSLRSTRTGALLFYAWKIQKRQIGAYRVDRIQSIEVTKTPFKPKFHIEFTSKGRVSAPFTKRTRRFISSWSSHSTAKYVVECSVCGKRFSRKKYSLILNRHKALGSEYNCSGRYGYMV